MPPRTISGEPRIAPPETTVPFSDKSQGLSVDGINARTARAEEMAQIFASIQPGQKLKNASAFLERLRLFETRERQDRALLGRPKFKATPEAKRALEALEHQKTVLAKVRSIAESQGIIPRGTVARASSKTEGYPWEGKLREGETPLHWAVRNHDHQTALMIRYQIRQMRLFHLTAAYVEIAKPYIKNDTRLLAILQKPETLPKLVQAIEILHAIYPSKPNPTVLRKIFTDPDIVKILESPGALQILDDPKTDPAKLTQDEIKIEQLKFELQKVLNCLDVLSDLDARGLSPVDEAFLQEDYTMTQILMFPHLLASPALNHNFMQRNEALRIRLASMRQVDSSTLSPTAQAAYYGDVDELMNEGDFDTPDEKGLTPLHYALIGGHSDAIEYLLPRCNLHYQTPRDSQGRSYSYLDYAIVGSHSRAFRVFQNINLPFTLGKERERFNYLVASGLIDDQLALSAKAKDPIAMGGRDQDLLGLVNINAVWAGAKLFNWTLGKYMGATPIDSSWLGYFGKGLENYALALNKYALGVPQTLQILPNWAHTAWHIYSFVNIFLFLFSPFMPLFSSPATWGTLTDLNLKSWTHLNTALDWASKGCIGLRLIGAVKPVFDRMPKYLENVQSRPGVVAKKLGWDLFNVGTQIGMSLPAFGF